MLLVRAGLNILKLFAAICVAACVSLEGVDSEIHHACMALANAMVIVVCYQMLVSPYTYVMFTSKYLTNRCLRKPQNQRLGQK